MEQEKPTIDLGSIFINEEEAQMYLRSIHISSKLSEKLLLLEEEGVDTTQLPEFEILNAYMDFFSEYNVWENVKPERMPVVLN